MAIAPISSAQQAERLAVLSKANKDNIELRWAPLDYEAWAFGNSNGYIVERSTILRKGKLLNPVERKVLTPSPIKVAGMQEWAKYEDDKYAMIAGECILGEAAENGSDFLPMKAYRRHQDNERRHGFALYSADMSINAARLSGLYYKDSDVKPDEKYLYKILFAKADSLVCDTATAFSGIAEYQPLAAPEKPFFYCEKNKITLWWHHVGIAKFNSYYIERSGDNGKTFSRISDTPIAVSMQGSSSRTYYSDTLADANSSYQYRIVGVDSFGEESPASEAVSAKLLPPLDRDPEFTGITTVNNNSVHLNWYYDSDADIKGFKIYRSKSPKSRKTMILNGSDPLQRSFTDPQPMNDNYYFLSVYNDSNERINPFPIYAQLIDSVPPVAPSKPSGYCDSLGRVHLAWSRHSDDDVIGYRLLRSNSEDRNFMMCVPYMIADTFYVDTISLNTLSKKIYYKLSAVDSRSNQSDLSGVAIIPRYDTIAPVAPAFNSISMQKNKVQLSISKSPSKDVEKYVVFRKLAGSYMFDTLAVVAPSQQTYIDQTACQGEKYHYGIQAVDDFGNKSEIAKQSFTLPKNKDDAIQLKKKLSGGTVTLSWTSSSTKNVTLATIYRKTGDDPLKTYSQASGIGSFSDSNLQLGVSYTYCIRLTYADGTESALSNEVKVEY